MTLNEIDIANHLEKFAKFPIATSYEENEPRMIINCKSGKTTEEFYYSMFKKEFKDILSSVVSSVLLFFSF
jgi:hypothetical protein